MAAILWPAGRLLAQGETQSLLPAVPVHTLLTALPPPYRQPATLASPARPAAADSSYNWGAGWIGALAGAAGAVAVVALFAGGASESEDGAALTYVGVGVLGGLIGFFTGLVIGNQ